MRSSRECPAHCRSTQRACSAEQFCRLLRNGGVHVVSEQPYTRDMDADLLRIEADGDDLLLWVKSVPGGSRDAIAGVVGDRLKVKVVAPAEGGRANKAICALIADAFGIKPRDVSIHTGQTNPEKIIRIGTAGGLTVDSIRERLRASR